MTTTRSVLRTLTVLALALLAIGCGPARDATVPDGLELALDRKGERDLLAFYLGGYVPGNASDPFEAGLIVETGGRFIIPDSVLASDPGRHLAPLTATAGEDGIVDWDEFESFILETWPSVRNAPASTDDARDRYGDWSDEQAWFRMDVTGSMSPYRRHISVPMSDLRSAIEQMSSLDDPVLYPDGTVFVGEHVQESAGDFRVVETTFMVKRSDGLWDYFAYDDDGLWATSIENDPSDLNVPTQCVGCHFGTRQFEPERSFPADARPGPSGPRLVHIDPALRSSDLTRRLGNRLQEHTSRSDTILGLYATLYLARIGAAGMDALDDWERSTRARLLADEGA